MPDDLMKYVGQDIDYMGSQPLYPYIELKIGDVTVSDFGNEYPDCVMSLTVDRRNIAGKDSAGDTFELTLFDETAIEIENLLYEQIGKGYSGSSGTKSGLQAFIRYGWADAKGNILGEVDINALITNYSLTFEASSTSLTVTGISVPAANLHKTDTIEFPGDKYGNPAKIVQAVLEKANVRVGHIEPTKDVYMTSSDEKQSFNCTNETYISFIQNKMCPIAVASNSQSEAGSTGYTFYYDEKGGGAFFVPRNVGMEVPSVIGSEGDNSSLSSVVKSFLSDASNAKNLLNKLIQGAGNLIGQVASGIESSQKVASRVVNTVNAVTGGGGSTTPGNYMEKSSDSETSTTFSEKSTTTGNVIMVGDSQLIDVYKKMNGDSSITSSGSLDTIDDEGTHWFADEGATLWWLKSVGEKRILSYATNGSVVIIQIGSNDMNNASGYRGYLIQLKQKIEAQGATMVLVSTMPVVNETRMKDNTRAETLNNVFKEVAGEDKYVDMYEDLKKRIEEKESEGETVESASSVLSDSDTMSLSEKIDEFQKIYDSISNVGVESGGTFVEGASNIVNEILNKANAGWYQTIYYEYYSGKQNSQVISFSPEWSNQPVMRMTDGGVSESINDMSGEFATVLMGGDAIRGYGILGKSSSDYKKLKTASLNLWNQCYARCNGATMEIMGDPNVTLTSIIGVAVYTKYGYLHHTSGAYMVKSIQDNISAGSYVTSLDLTKMPNVQLPGITNYFGDTKLESNLLAQGAKAKEEAEKQKKAQETKEQSQGHSGKTLNKNGQYIKEDGTVETVMLRFERIDGGLYNVGDNGLVYRERYDITGIILEGYDFVGVYEQMVKSTNQNSN